MIADLLCRGMRVGVTANSHKVILNLMRAVVEALGSAAGPAPLYKVGDHEDDPLVQQGIVRELDGDDVPAVLDAGAALVGGTAWLYSREDLEGRFDYVFVDEAGQVSLANAVAVGLSTRNLILIGDQMQLAQPIQGSHPGETGLSAWNTSSRATPPSRPSSASSWRSRGGCIPTSAASSPRQSTTAGSATSRRPNGTA
jgi:uncharacterized protein